MQPLPDLIRVSHMAHIFNAKQGHQLRMSGVKCEPVAPPRRNPHLIALSKYQFNGLTSSPCRTNLVWWGPQRPPELPFQTQRVWPRPEPPFQTQLVLRGLLWTGPVLLVVGFVNHHGGPFSSVQTVRGKQGRGLQTVGVSWYVMMSALNPQPMPGPAPSFLFH